VRVAFHLVDVFAEAPFTGNQLCIVSEAPDGLSDAAMQTIAREIGFSETAYVTAIRKDGYDIRIFTPVAELPFAGHPTLGTAFTLASLGLVLPSVVQTSAAGEVPVEVDLENGTGTMWQLPPVFGEPIDDRAAVARAAGSEPGDLGDGEIVWSAPLGSRTSWCRSRARQRCAAPPGTTPDAPACAPMPAPSRSTSSRSGVKGT
jgi:trans-2,3-dihydro-3-hydroxyanthranilate isomerase